MGRWWTVLRRPRFAALAAVATFLAALVVFVPRALAPRDYLKDEAAKISESYYFRFFLRDGFDPASWFVSKYERTNPPVGKYVFGAAIRAWGAELPKVPDLASSSDQTHYVPPAGSEALFARAIGPARVVSAVATAAILALVLWLAWTTAGPAAGAIALVLLWRHYLTATLATMAIFDALQTALIAGAMVVLAPVLTPVRRGSLYARAAVAGSLVGLAFQTRLNGILAIVPALLLVAAASHQPRRTRLLAAAGLTVCCGLVAIASNPFYWAAGPDGATPLLRVPQRVVWQLRDVQDVVAEQDPTHLTRTIAAKVTCAIEILGSGSSGKILWAGMGLGLAMGGWRRRWRDVVICATSLVWVLVLVLWLPLRWERYLYPAIPLMAWAAAIGWASLFESRRRVRDAKPGEVLTGEDVLPT